MKRVLYFSFMILVSVSLFAAAMFLPACSPAIERFAPLISELRDDVLTASSQNYSVSIITGKREDPFVLDGIAGETRDYTLITVTPAALIESLSYKAVVDGVEYSGKMVPHPFAASFSAEIKVRSYNSEILLELVSSDGMSEPLTVKSVKTESMIPASKAVEIAERKLGNSISAFKDGNELNCEIFVRLISNPIDNSGGYHWYVAFIGSDQTIYAVLIEPVTMEVVAIRE